jgi:hypothetical protein
MKRFLVLMMAIVMTATFVCCDSNTPEASTNAPEITTEEVTTEDITIPVQTTETETETEDLPYDAVDIPVIDALNDKALHGYHVSGEFELTDAHALSKGDNNMFIVTNDKMTSGKITATFKAPAQQNNDNGIVFGMTEDFNDQYYLWEDGPTYYFLFVSDGGTLYLAKVAYGGNPWTELQVTAPIENYKHGDEVTMSVEFDGEGTIDCYVNGECLIYYYDDKWSGGSLYGIRCEVPGVQYSEVIADSSWTAD